MPQFEGAWLRALAHACGPRNRPVTSVEVARALHEVERVVGRVTGQAAAANLLPLAASGLAESWWEAGRKLWRLTAAGVDELAGRSAAAPAPSPPTVVRPASATGLAHRLAEVVQAYNHGDLATIDVELASDVVLFIPGFNALAGTYAGRGQVITLLSENRGHQLPELRLVEGLEEAGEARVRVVAEVAGPAGERTELEMWIRARPDPDGRIVEIVLQPEDQRVFDRAVGRSRRSTGQGPDHGV